jgi:DNA invertase Pin-like site-specific DNA recombinase
MQMDRTPIPAVIYAARSQAEEPGKDSTGDQIALIRERIKREDGRVIFGEPHADHASGFKGNRGPGLEAAIHDAERAAGEHGQAELWVWHTTRLGRGTGHLGAARAIGHLLYELRSRGIACRSVEDDEFATNEMLWGFASRMASKYSEDLAANTTRGINSYVRNGKPWGEPRFGYTKGDDGHWIVEPAEAATAVRAYREFVDGGRSYNGIQQLFNREGVPTRRGSRWTATVIRRILTSRHVLGEFHHNGEWHQGSHPAIIDEATWNAAQALADRNRKYAPKGHSGRLPKNHIFIRGMFKCGICGEAMIPRSGPPETYACRRHRADTEACPMPFLPRHAVESAALRMFEVAALDVEATRRHVAEQMGARLNEARTQAERASREVAAKRAALYRFDREHEDGQLSATNYERQVARVGEELAAAEAERERLTAHAESITDRLDDLDAESETLRRLAELRSEVSARMSDAAGSGDVGALRAAWARVFEACYVVPRSRFADVPDLFAPLPGRLDPDEYEGEDDPYDDEPIPRLYLVPVPRVDMLNVPDDDPAGFTVADALVPVPSSDSVRRVAMGFDVEAVARNNRSVSGVPE